jgi:hypothetical protein
MARSILSVITGLVVIMALVMISTLVTALAMLGGMDQPPTQAYLVVNILCGALSAFAGGYVTAWIARQKALQHALALSALLLLLGLPGLFAQSPGQPAWYPLVILVTGVAFSLAGGTVRGRQAAQP